MATSKRWQDEVGSSLREIAKAIEGVREPGFAGAIKAFESAQQAYERSPLRTLLGALEDVEAGADVAHLASEAIETEGEDVTDKQAATKPPSRAR